MFTNRIREKVTQKGNVAKDHGHIFEMNDDIFPRSIKVGRDG